MKSLSVRTIQGGRFEIELAENLTVSDARRMLSEKYHNEAFINGNMILDGALLKNTTVIGSLDVEKPKCIIAHLGMPAKYVNIPKISQKTHAPTKSAPHKKPSIEDPSRKRKPEPPSATAEKAHPQPSQQPNHSEMIENLMALGFARERCEKALRDANNDLDEAVVKLLGGAESVQSPGSSSNSNRFGEGRGRYDSLSAEEKQSVEKIIASGANPELAIDIYFSENKNEEAALAAYQAMLN